MIQNGKQPAAAKHWSKQAKAFWQRTLQAFVLSDEHHLQLLRSACEQLTRMDECRKVLEAEGITVRDRWQQSKAHPLLAEERAAANCFRLLVRETGLDTDAVAEVRGPRARGYAQ